jgi:Fe-S oxidoreductase
MPANILTTFIGILAGCRFCPMCKPAGEVGNLTLLESHTTRARAMLLWRIATGIAGWEKRPAELIYQSTLDSISQAWCVSHYPVSDYMTAARAEAFATGLAPDCVHKVLQRIVPDPVDMESEVLLLASEAAELGDASLTQPALRVLERIGIRAATVAPLSGALAYSLGAQDSAREQAIRVVEFIRRSKAQLVIADGPQTLWALHRIYPTLDVEMPDYVEIVSLSEYLDRAIQQGKLKSPDYRRERILFHDSRSACLLADQMADATAIQPGYQGPQETLGRGEVFESPRRLLGAMKMDLLYSVWSHSLSRSCGADDGLWLTYPALAQGLAKQRLLEAKRLGAELLVSDSLLCARHLACMAGDGDPRVLWLPELIELK